MKKLSITLLMIVFLTASQLPDITVFASSFSEPSTIEDLLKDSELLLSVVEGCAKDAAQGADTNRAECYNASFAEGASGKKTLQGITY